MVEQWDREEIKILKKKLEIEWENVLVRIVGKIDPLLMVVQKDKDRHISVVLKPDHINIHLTQHKSKKHIDIANINLEGISKKISRKLTPNKQMSAEEFKRHYKDHTIILLNMEEIPSLEALQTIQKGGQIGDVLYQKQQRVVDTDYKSVNIGMLIHNNQFVCNILCHNDIVMPFPHEQMDNIAKYITNVWEHKIPKANAEMDKM